MNRSEVYEVSSSSISTFMMKPRIRCFVPQENDCPYIMFFYQYYTTNKCLILNHKKAHKLQFDILSSLNKDMEDFEVDKKVQSILSTYKNTQDVSHSFFLNNIDDLSYEALVKIVKLFEHRQEVMIQEADGMSQAEKNKNKSWEDVVSEVYDQCSSDYEYHIIDGEISDAIVYDLTNNRKLLIAALAKGPESMEYQQYQKQKNMQKSEFINFLEWKVL